ncbi:MAG: hypothetical protein LQ345_003432 [Seirophora villosa]|nr:MAG: hypothetical protein LQ345_003432 [Seirophora villosa]
MYPSLRLLAQHQRTPLIKFLGKRSFPSIPLPSSSQSSLISCAEPAPPSNQSSPPEEEPPHPHPASPTHDLPSSFVAYRSSAQQHGPLARQTRHESSSAPPSSASSSSSPSKPPAPVPASRAYGAIGGHSGHSLGSVAPGRGLVMDRTELPERFWGLRWTEEEIEGVELGGANLKVGWGGS